MAREREMFAVVIPAYNEGPTLTAHLEAVGAALVDAGPGHALVVVDDGSSDDTAEAIAAATVPEGVEFRSLQHAQNQGYGAALRTGTEGAAELGSAWVLYMDADGTNPPDHITRFLDAAGPDVDHLKATRYGPGARVDGVPFLHRTVSRLGNSVTRLLLRSAPRDTTNGFRAIRTEHALAMPLSERGFPVIMEELRWAYRAHLRGRDVPTSLGTRSEEQRPTAFGYRPSTMWHYFRHVLAAVGDRFRGRSTRGWRVPDDEGPMSNER
jgi:dolichol-phosphate mannosyltransferase